MDLLVRLGVGLDGRAADGLNSCDERGGRWRREKTRAAQIFLQLNFFLIGERSEIQHFKALLLGIAGWCTHNCEGFLQE
jgi:hypothetical protein